MRDLLPLQKIESDYKEFSEKYGLVSYEHPITLESFHRFLLECDPKYHHLYLGDFDDALKEEAFFEESQDIVALKHYRYMPPTLHSHTFFELAYIVSGTLYNYIGDQCITLEAGDLLILAPGTTHAVYANRDDSIMINILIRSSTFEQHFMNVIPRHELLYDFFLKTLYRPSATPYLLFHTGDDKSLSSLILNMHREYNYNRRYKETALQALASLMLVTLLRNHETDVIIPGMNPSVMNEKTLLIIQYMQKHYTTVTLQELASFFNYSDRQIQRIITTATGKSFSDNIKQMRMLKSRELIRSTTLSVSEIADYLGYYDASNFRQTFKKYFGLTPGEYRMKNQNQPGTCQCEFREEAGQ